MDKPINCAFVMIPLGSFNSPHDFKVYGLTCESPLFPIEHKVWWPQYQKVYPELLNISYQHLPRGRIVFNQKTNEYELFMWRWFYEFWDLDRLIKALNEYFKITVSPTGIFNAPWDDYTIDLKQLQMAIHQYSEQHKNAK